MNARAMENYTSGDFTVAESGALVSEACDLGWAPGGDVPGVFAIDGMIHLWVDSRRDNCGDVSSWTFATKSGAIAVVFND